MDIVGILLQHGATVDAVTKDSYTALHIAAKEGQEEVASLLLDHQASLTATTKVLVPPATAVQVALPYASLSLSLASLQKGFTPLHLSAKYGNIKVARLLLAREAPVDAQGKVIR